MPTPDNRVKFATYFRDENGPDYADQRYYSPGVGRFMTPDPSNLNEKLSSPSSWNKYTYVEGDPVNFNDPEGLACTDVTLTGWPGIPNRQTVGEFLSQKSDLAAFAITIFTETRIAIDMDATAEKAAVAGVIMNRWQFVNGYATLYDKAKGSGRGTRGTPRVVPDWGEEDGTLTSIVFAKGQFEPWISDWELGPSEQDRLNRAMRSSDNPRDPGSEQCGSLLQSIIAASEFWYARNDHELYASNGLFFTGFAAPARGKEPTKAYYEESIGSFGSINVFFWCRSRSGRGPTPGR